MTRLFHFTYFIFKYILKIIEVNINKVNFQKQTGVIHENMDIVYPNYLDYSV